MSDSTDPRDPSQTDDDVDSKRTGGPATRRARREATEGETQRPFAGAGAAPAVVLGAAIVLLTAGLLWWFVVRDSPAEEPGTTTDITERVEEPGIDGVILPDADPDEWLAGDCLVDFQTQAEHAPATIVECDQDYEVQVVHWENLDQENYPGDDVIDERARMTCEEHGRLDQEAVDAVDFELEVRISRPTESTWDQEDDRRVNCLLQRTDGGSLTGSFVEDPEERSSADESDDEDDDDQDEGDGDEDGDDDEGEDTSDDSSDQEDDQ